MADAADDKKPSEEGAALDETLVATPGREGAASGPSGGGRPVPADATALEVDTSDRYALSEVHAAGGLGRVMRARDRRLHRTVAVKELLQRTPAAEARFIREALITAQLEHPGIVPVHDAGRWPSGEPFYSMKLVSGRTLRDLIQTRKGLDERLALVPNAIAVAEAIAYAHSREVIHRDIKPPNVLVGDFGETLVIDWGLAKDLSGRVAEPEVEAIAAASGSGSGDLATAAGNVMGTPAYMSPEQARGEEVDARADVYSLGALLYEVLTGKPPHEGPSVQEVIASAQKGQVAPVSEREPDAPPDLCAIVDKAMAPERADRYTTAMEMAADLRRFQTGQLVTARHYSTPALVWRWIARHRAMVAVVTGAIAALAVVGVVSFRRVMTQRNRAETQMHIAESRRDELVFLQAESLLERDPTAALAWLKGYPIGGEQALRLGPMIDDALAAGVARHVLPHPAWVHRLAFTPDGMLVTADGDGNVVSWDPASGRGRPIRHHTGVPEVVLFTPDGARLAISYRDGSIEIQPTRGGAARKLTALPTNASMLVSDDSRRLVALSDGHLRVWDLTSGEELLALDREEGRNATLSPDGSRLYISRRSGEIAEFRPGAGQAARTVARLADPAVQLKVSPDGKSMLVYDIALGIQLLDLASGKTRPLGRHLMRHDNWLQFSHAGDRVALAFADGSIGVYQVASGAETILRGHGDPVYQLTFSPDDTQLYSAGDDGTVRIWNLVSNEARVLRGHGDDVVRIALSPDGKWLASASFDRTARLWPLDGGVARVLPGHVIDAEQVAFVAGGTRLVAGNQTRAGESWDLATGKSFRVKLDFVPDTGPPALGDRLLIAIDSKGRAELRDLTTDRVRLLSPPSGEPITAVGISKDDARAVTVDRSNALFLWDLATGEARSVAIERAPHLVAFLPGRREVVLAGSGFLELWDLERARAVSRAKLPMARAHLPSGIDVSGDGRVIASRGREGVLVAWDTTGSQVSVIDAGDEVSGIDVSPDGRQIALALGDRTVKLWEPASGSSKIIVGHTDLVHRAVFSPDGGMLASCSFDRTVRLFSFESLQSRVLRGHGTEVKSVAFSPDGETLASVGGDGTVRLWPLAALSDLRPAAAPARLNAATSAVVVRGGRITTPDR